MFARAEIQTAAKYRIGAVANLTGVSTHAIRAWERRYGLRLGKRSQGGTRLYSDGDIIRLSLLKSLLKKGEAISAIADLSIEQLKERMLKHAQSKEPKEDFQHSSAPDLTHQKVVTAIWGRQMNLFVDESFEGTYNLEVRLKAEDKEMDFLKDEAKGVHCLLAHVEDIRNPVEWVHEWKKNHGDSVIIMAYDFISKMVLSELIAAGVRLIKWPVEAEIFGSFIRDQLMLQQMSSLFFWMSRDDASGELLPKRLFNDDLLLRLRNGNNPLASECTRHLSTLISDLSAFERYCEKCSKGNENNTELHSQLHRQTALARFMMEQMFNRIVQEDKKSLS